MTTQAKHTPGKLRVGDAGHTLFGPPNGNPSPETIAQGIKNKANAARLAHCWNQHDALVSALRTCLDALERLPAIEPINWNGKAQDQAVSIRAS